MTWNGPVRHFGRPTLVGVARTFDPNETPAWLAAVRSEVGEAFATDRFAVLRRERTVAQMYAAAALAHCCHLAGVVVDLHARGDELAARMIARGVFESWTVGLFLHYGGYEAANALWGDFHHEVKTQAEQAELHDSELRRKRKAVAEANAKIERNNVGKRAWNEAHPGETPKRLEELLPDVPGVLIEYDWSERMHLFAESTPQKLPLKTMIDKLRVLTREAGDEQTFDAAYVYMFRGLSTVGAHTNLRVLDWYLDDADGRATFVRARQDARPPSSLQDANLLSVLLLVAHLSQLVLESRGCSHAAADQVMDRFNEMQARPDEPANGEDPP